MTRGLLVLAITAVSAPAFGFEFDRNFAGSAQLDYLAVPTNPDARKLTFDGFTTELSVKLAVDFGENFSANVKVCYGCHGFETDMAFVDMRVVDELNFRVGRFNPQFGEFPLRHDPANHRANSKPLPYDMGRMLRLREWNMSVVPSPYADNGLEINGTHWFGDSVQLDYAGYVVSGFKGSDDGLDIDFVQSRTGSLYYVDNNSEPAFGGRVAVSVDASDSVAFTLGASGMYGHYDPSRELEYLVLGADMFLRISDLVIRGEYLIRRTDFGVGGDERRFRYALDPDRNFFTKEGFYIEAEHPLGDSLELLARFDGLRRTGNVAVTSALRSESAVYRYTLGCNVLLARGLRTKLDLEVWDFSDFADEVAAHVGIVASF